MKWLGNRYVISVTLVVSVLLNCYEATLGLWWLRPFALFVALMATHVLLGFFVLWRDQDRNAMMESFVQWMQQRQHTAEATRDETDTARPN